MKKSRKQRIILWSSVCAGVILLVVFLALNVNICWNPGGSNGCISVAFDKQAMKNADRAVIWVDGEQFTITDVELVQEISNQTAVASYCACSSERDRWIELYDGDKLVRRMNWEVAHDSVVVYHEDLTHWIVGYESGQVSLSKELLDTLYEIIGEESDPYCFQSTRD